MKDAPPFVVCWQDLFLPIRLALRLITNYELRITKYKLQITNYELRITGGELVTEEERKRGELWRECNNGILPLQFVIRNS
jgi:hypothetical protein